MPINEEKLRALKRPALMKLAKAVGIESINSKTNEVLADMILEIKSKPQPVSYVKDQVIMDAIDHQMTDENAPVKELQNPYEAHWRRAYDIPQGATLDLCIHEDMDELQAYNITDDEKQFPLVQFTFLGCRGAGRKAIQGKVRRALERLGFEIRYMGITIQ